jgi:hypothetical protein
MRYIDQLELIFGRVASGGRCLGGCQNEIQCRVIITGMIILRL